MVLKDHRKRSSYASKAFRWGVCADGSSISNRALKLVCQMMHPQDRLTVITVAEKIVTAEHVHKEVDKVAAETGIKASKVDKVVLPHPEGEAVWKVIKGYLMS